MHFVDSRDQSVKELVGLREYCEELLEAYTRTHIHAHVRPRAHAHAYACVYARA